MSAADSQLYPETAEVAFPRWWIQQIRDQLFTWDRLPSGPLGDWAFLFREQLNDKLSQPVDPAQGKQDRDKLAAMLKTNGFTSRDGTYLQGGTYRIIDAILSALSSTDRRGPRHPGAISPEPPENAQ